MQNPSPNLVQSVNTHLKYARKYMICQHQRPISKKVVPNPNHLTRLFVLSFVSRSFCSRARRYSISWTDSATISSMRRRSASTGLSFSVAWMADQSFASAPISMSRST